MGENTAWSEEFFVDNRDKELWDNTVKPYLEGDLWSERDMYDASSVLMAPLHAAFYLNQPVWQKQFSDHFHRYMEKDNTSFATTSQSIDLDREQYLYLISRFIVLSVRFNRRDLIPEGLPERLQKEVVILWREKPAWWFEPSHFKGGIRERLNYKLKQSKTKISYYRAITDHDMFLIAIAADLNTYDRLTKSDQAKNMINLEILDSAYEVMQQRVKYTSAGGWLFQPGVWRDHPDHAYAGHVAMSPGMPKKPVDDIAEDSSHSHRWPLWLLSLSEGSDDSARINYYQDLRKRLEKQLFEVVLVKPSESFPYYRVANYMDGRNGVYRWGYATNAKNDGCGPYELSGILVCGWWGMLGTNQSRSLYSDMSKRFPLDQAALDVYVGPNTSRDRNPLVKWPDYFTNGFAELVVRLFSKLDL